MEGNSVDAETVTLITPPEIENDLAVRARER